MLTIKSSILGIRSSEFLRLEIDFYSKKLERIIKNKIEVTAFADL